MLDFAGAKSSAYPPGNSPWPLSGSSHARDALAKLFADGSALVQSDSQDLGTGTYTVMTQVAGSQKNAAEMHPPRFFLLLAFRR